MKTFTFTARSLFIAVATMAVTLSVGGWGLWSLAAAHYQATIDHWIDTGRAAGYRIHYETRQVFGFPHNITMRLHDLQWRNTDGIDFHADDMDIHITPWDLAHYQVKFKNHATVTAPTDDKDHALLLAATSGRAAITLNADGTWQMAQLNLEEAQFGLAPAYLFTTAHLTAAITRPTIPPQDHTQIGLQLEGEADTITLPTAMPSPFGNQARKLSAHIRVMGRVPDVRTRLSVDAWNKDFGIVEFDDLAIHWGALDMESKGTVGFDDDLQPEGAFAGTVANPQKTMQILSDQGFIASHDAGMLQSAMNLFAKPAAKGGTGMEFPITVQLGGLFFGPIRLFTFPEIEWPVEPPPIK